MLTSVGSEGSTRHALTQKLARSSVQAFAVYIVGAGLTYCAQLAIARLIGAAAYGNYAYVFAWATVLAYMSALGFDISLLRLVAAHRARGEPGIARAAVAFAERCATRAGLAVCAAGMAAIILTGDRIDGELHDTFLVGLALVPVWALLWVRCSAIRGQGGVTSALAPDRIIRDGTLLVLLGVGWSLHATVTASSAMAMTLAGSVFGLLIASLHLNRGRPREVGSRLQRFDAAAWRTTVIPLILISLGETVLNRTGVVLLGWEGNTRDAGVYSVAFTIAAAVLLPRTAINALFAPAVSELFSRGDTEGLQHIVTRTASWTLISGVLVAAPLVFGADTIMSLFGADFVHGATALRILVIGQLVSAGAGPQMFLLTMTGNERIGAALMCASVMFNAIGSFFLTSRFGSSGAAAMTTVTLVAFNLGMAMAAFHRLGVIPAGLGVIARPYRATTPGE